MPEQTQKLKLGQKNLAMLPSYFDYIFVHLRQKARLRPESSPKFLSTLGPKSLTGKARPDLQFCSSKLELITHGKTVSLLWCPY